MQKEFGEGSLEPGELSGESQPATVEQMQQQEALGRSKGGLSTKIHIQTEGMGKPMHFSLSQGQTSDVKGFGELNPQIKVKCQERGRPKQGPRYLVGDKADDSQAIRRTLRCQRTTPVIPKRQDAKRKPRFNRGLYRERNRIERLINRLKQFRRTATARGSGSSERLG